MTCDRKHNPSQVLTTPAAAPTSWPVSNITQPLCDGAVSHLLCNVLGCFWTASVSQADVCNNPCARLQLDNGDAGGTDDDHLLYGQLAVSVDVCDNIDNTKNHQGMSSTAAHVKATVQSWMPLRLHTAAPLSTPPSLPSYMDCVYRKPFTTLSEAVSSATCSLPSKATLQAKRASAPPPSRPCVTISEITVYCIGVLTLAVPAQLGRDALQC